jgi:probable HAF family extracellular repeat protein
MMNCKRFRRSGAIAHAGLSRIILVSMALSGASVQAAVTYSIKDLGAFSGTNFSAGYALNNLGQVVGESGSSSNRHAFLYDGSSMIDLGTLGGKTSIANGVNDAGLVVGSSRTSDRGTRAFSYQNGVMSEIALPGSFSEATAVNNAGKIVGYYRPGTPSVIRTAGFTAFNGSVATYEGTIDLRFNAVSDMDKFYQTQTGSPVGTTDRGEVQGIGNDWPVNSGPRQPSKPFTEVLDSIQVAGPAPDGATEGEGWGTNDERDLVGDATIGGVKRAVFWNFDPHDGYHTTVIPGLDGKLASVAWDINNSSQVVGGTGFGVGTTQSGIFTDGGFGFIYNGGVTTNLNDLLDPASGWYVAAAYAINEHAQITGVGIIDGKAHAYLMTPLSYSPPTVPEPASWAMMLTGFGAVGGALRSRRKLRRALSDQIAPVGSGR